MSQSDSRACLACCAIHGFHSVVKYAWFRNEMPMSEDTPLLYTSCDGTYLCKVTHGDKQLSGKFVMERTLVIGCSNQVSIILTIESWNGILVRCTFDNQCDVSQKGKVS